MQRIAMLGSGFIGRFYADSLQGQRSRDKVISIYSRKEESAKKFANQYGCTHWTTKMEEAIAHPEVTIVCIALPNNLHEEAVLLCCKHKKAVMTTKPLGRNATEAKRMLDAVEKAGIFNGYLEDLVYTPKFLKSMESVKNGALGRILWAKSRETHPGPHSEWFWDLEQAGGGCILDLGCHCVEITRSFIGKDIKPIEVMCWADTQVKPIDAEDHAIALVNLGEVTSGLAMISALPPGTRSIVTGLTTEFLKKARGTLTAECGCQLPPALADGLEQVVIARITDYTGEVVARVSVTWRLGVQPS